MPSSRVLPEANSYLHQVRPTPLVRVSLGDGQPGGAGCDTAEPGIWCKLEFLNPSGSTKDRIARHILEKAWRQGQLSAGDTVAEASSGSTSIAFALACSQMGLHFVAFIPDTATSEREVIIRAYGGEVRWVGGGMPEVLRTAGETSASEGWFLGRQFANDDNTEAHRLHTGPEILSQIPGGAVDAVVSGVAPCAVSTRPLPGPVARSVPTPPFHVTLPSLEPMPSATACASAAMSRRGGRLERKLRPVAV